ncbi:MAG: cohesin domain-containing protein [Anaerolineae bacterium]
MKAKHLIIVISLVVVGLVAPMGAHQIAAEVNTCPGTGPVNLALIPSGYVSQVGEQIDVILQVQAGSQTVNIVSAFVNFDPAELQAVSMTSGTSLPLILNSGINNSAGMIDYEAGTLGGQPPSGTFTLATVRFQSLVARPTSPIVFECGMPRTTDAFLNGISILGSLQNANVALSVTLASFDATAQVDHVLVSWQTSSEINNMGFNLYRTMNPAGPRIPLQYIPSQAPGSSQGFAYEWIDNDVMSGQTYYYWLEDIDLNGTTTLHGPVSATVDAPTAVTISDLHSSSQPAGGWLAELIEAVKAFVTITLSR